MAYSEVRSSGKAGKLLPDGADPAHHLVRIVAADKRVVGDVVVLRSRPVVVHGAADVVDLRMLQREAACAGDVLDAEEKRDIRVANREAFE